MPVLLALGVIIIVGLLLEKIYEKSWSKGLKVRLNFDRKEAMQGDSIEILENVSNTSGLFLPFMHLKYDIKRNGEHYKNRSGVFSLSYRQKVTRHTGYICASRGCYDIGSTYLVYKGFLLRSTLEKTIPQRSKLVVYPKLVDVEDVPVYAFLTDGECKHNPRIIEDRLAFRDIRQYEDTDAMSRINWNATARSDDLMVNIYEDMRRAAVRLVMELPDDYYEEADKLQETAISVAASLYVRLLRDNVTVGFVSNGADAYTKEPVCLQERNDSDYEKEVLVSLARINGFVDSNTAEMYLLDAPVLHETIILISAMGDMSKGLKSHIFRMAQQGCKVLWIVLVSKRDTESLKEAKEKIQDYGLENRVVIYEWK